MFKVTILKTYKDGTQDEITFGRTTINKAEELYHQEVKNAKKVVDFIPVKNIAISLHKGKSNNSIEFISIISVH